MIFDLIALQESAEWTPDFLFLNGESGFWFDSTDFTMMFQDSGGTTPVTANGQPVGLWKNKIANQAIPFDLTMATSSMRPQLKIVGGKNTISYDGIDDYLAFSSDPLLNVDCTNGACIAAGFTAQMPVTDRNILYTGGGYESIVPRSTGQVNTNLLGQSLRTVGVFSPSGMNTILLTAKSYTDALTVILNGVGATGSIPTKGAVNFRNEEIPNQTSGTLEISQFVFINRLLTQTERTQLESFIASKH